MLYVLHWRLVVVPLVNMSRSFGRSLKDIGVKIDNLFQNTKKSFLSKYLSKTFSDRIQILVCEELESAWFGNAKLELC